MSLAATSRPTGVKWRRNAFAALVERDGEQCCLCECEGRTIWRNIGYGTGPQWGADPWETSRFSKVHPTSNLEVDHRTPLSCGGDNSLSNLWLLCIDCHKAKTVQERSQRLKALFAEARA